MYVIHSEASKVAYTATAAQSSALTVPTSEPRGAAVYRLVSTTACHILIGENPTATTDSTFLPAGVIEYISVPSGYKISAIRNSADGSLFINRLVKVPG